MKVAAFDYFAPSTLQEAAVLLDAWAPSDGRIIAGGQSLVPAMAFRMAQPGALIDINRVAGPKEPVVDGSDLLIWLGVRHAGCQGGVCDGPLGRLLDHVGSHIAHLPIRHRGTFCGSLAHADPSSEWCLVAATLGARMELVSVNGTRTVDAEAFFVDAMTTALEPNEVLACARLPRLRSETRFGFEEFARRAGDYALASALVLLDIEAGRARNVRIGIGGVEQRPRRIAEAEAAAEGCRLDPRLADKVADLAAAAVDPMEDPNAPADYRRELARAAVRRAFLKAAA